MGKDFARNQRLSHRKHAGGIAKPSAGLLPAANRPRATRNRLLRGLHAKRTDASVASVPQSTGFYLGSFLSSRSIRSDGSSNGLMVMS